MSSQNNVKNIFLLAFRNGLGVLVADGMFLCVPTLRQRTDNCILYTDYVVSR